VQVKTIRHRLMLDAVQAKNPLAALLPTHCNAWWPLVEDVFSSPACKNLRTTLMDKGISHGECASISVDGTFKVCLPLLGQGRFSDPPAVRDEFPFAGDDAYTRVITVRGRSGAGYGASSGRKWSRHCQVLNHVLARSRAHASETSCNGQPFQKDARRNPRSLSQLANLVLGSDAHCYDI